MSEGLRVTIGSIGSKNVEIKNLNGFKCSVGDAIYVPTNLRSIIGLRYNDEILAYRFVFEDGYIRDIEKSVLRCFKIVIKEDCIEDLLEFKGLLATKKEIEVNEMVEDISCNFAKCVELIERLNSNTREKDKYKIEDIKKLARKFYKYGGDVIIECWEDSDIQELVSKEGVLERLSNIIDSRYDETANFENGEGYFW